MVFGGGSSNDVEIKVVLKDDGSFQFFDALGKEMDVVKQKTESASRGFSTMQADIVTLTSAVQLGKDALNFMAGAAQAVFDGISRGSEVDDISTSFNTLAEKAGAASDILLNDLNRAFGETIPNIDLMKDANALLLAGIEPDKIVQMADAARALGEQTGVDAKQGMEALTASILKGNAKAVESLGIIIDETKAYEEFAKANNIAAEEVKNLSEEAKKLAIREATFKALAEESKKFGEVTQDAGDKVVSIGKLMQDKFDEVYQSLAGDQGVNEALDGMLEAIKAIDIKQFAADVASLAEAFINLTTFGIQVATAAIDSFKTTAKAIPGIGDVIRAREFEQEAKNAIKSAIALRDSVGSGLTVGLKLAAGQFDKTEEAAKKTGKAFVNNSGDADKAKKAIDELAKANSEFNDSLRQLLKQDALPGVNQELENIFLDLKEGLIPTQEAERRIKDLARAYADSPQALKQFQTAMSESEKSADELDKQLTELADNPWTKEFIDKAEEAAKQFNETMQSTLGQGLGDAIGAAILGEDVRASIAAMGGQIGSQLGTSLGAAIGGPFGAAFGGAIGGALGDKLFENLSEFGSSSGKTSTAVANIIDTFLPGIGSGLDSLIGDKLFGGDSKGTQTRKAIDKFFADAFDANRLMVIIDGQLSQIKDLDLGGGLFGSADSEAGGFFAGLSSDAQAAFSGVASGFTSLLGVGQETALGLAQAFADNLGGSLNNLQLLVQASGASFEQLREVTVNAFLDGKLSALEAQSALNGLAQVAQEGIPDGIGFTIQAFENLKAAGTKGGRALIDAIKDIGHEAKEIGIRDFGALQANIAASGQFTAEEIQQVFDALAAAGITSIDQLTSASNEQLLPALAQLQSQDFPFADAAEGAAQLIETIDQLPNEKTLTFNIKTNFDSNSQKAQEQGYIPRNATGVSLTE
jgi:hypothetical protein